MLFYIFLYFLIVAFYMLGQNSRAEFKSVSLTTSFCLVWFAAGLRGSVGQDTLSYTKHFERLVDKQSMIDYFFDVEPFFAAFMVLSRLISDSVQFFFFSFALLQTTLLFYVIKRMAHPILFLAIYMFIFYANNHFNTLRAGLAVLFWLCAFSNSDNIRRGLAFALMGALTQISTLVLLPIMMLKMKFSFKQAAYVTSIGLVIALAIYFLYLDRLLLKLDVYSSDDSTAGLGIILYSVLIVIGVCALSFSKELEDYLWLCFFLLAISFLGIYFWSIFYRFYQIFMLVFLYLVLAKRGIWFPRFKISHLYAIGIGVIFSLLTLSVINSEMNRYMNSERGNIDFTFIPYTLFLNEK